MFLIAARFALSFGGDTWIQPEFLEGSSCKLELHFKSKIILTNLEKSRKHIPLIPCQNIDRLKVAKNYMGKVTISGCR